MTKETRVGYASLAALREIYVEGLRGFPESGRNSQEFRDYVTRAALLNLLLEESIDFSDDERGRLCPNADIKGDTITI